MHRAEKEKQQLSAEVDSVNIQLDTLNKAKVKS
jgi:hypothetical protein